MCSHASPSPGEAGRDLCLLLIRFSRTAVSNTEVRSFRFTKSSRAQQGLQYRQFMFSEFCASKPRSYQYTTGFGGGTKGERRKYGSRRRIVPPFAQGAFNEYRFGKFRLNPSVQFLRERKSLRRAILPGKEEDVQATESAD